MEFLTLPDGRRLAYRWYGPENGRPLLFFHGTPGTHLQAQMAEEVAASHGYRLLAPDRPGMAQSGQFENRRVEDWPGDIAALLDHHGIESAGLVAISGGGPYALQTAYALGKRTPHVTLLSSWVSYGREGLHAPSIPGFFKLYRWALRHAPSLADKMAAGVCWLSQREPNERMKQASLRFFPEDDRRLLRNPALYDLLLRDFKNVFAQGKTGPAHDAKLQFACPELDMAAITQPVHIWHGTADNIAPYAMAEYLAARLPNARLHTVPGGGHLCAADPALQKRIFAEIDAL